jgi:hypothetical protein
LGEIPGRQLVPKEQGLPALKQPQAWYEAIMTKEWGRYSRGAYVKKDQMMVSILKPHAPKRVFEPCGAEGNLARMMVESVPSIEEYALSDFVNFAVERMMESLADLPKITVTRIDIDEEYAGIDFRRFDLFLCTAFEHLANDREILQALSKGTTVALCLPNFGGKGHVRLFRTFEEIESRYGDLVHILERQEVLSGTRRVVVGVRE